MEEDEENASIPHVLQDGLDDLEEEVVALLAALLVDQAPSLGPLNVRRAPWDLSLEVLLPDLVAMKTTLWVTPSWESACQVRR